MEQEIIQNRLGLELNEDSSKQGISQKQFFILFALLISCITLLVGGGAYYIYLHDLLKFPSLKGKQELSFTGPSLNEGTPEQIQDRYYMPKNGLSPALKQAISHYQAKRRRQAVSELEAIIAGTAPTQQKAIALIYLGIIAMVRDRHELARHHFLRARAYEPDSIGALVNLAILERLVNDYASAHKYALQAQKLAPRDAHVLLLLGNLLLEKQRNGAAISTYEQALSGTENDNLLYYNLGLAYLRKGNTEQAIYNLKLVDKETTPVHIRLKAQAQLGQLFFERKQLDLAEAYLLKAVQLAPENGKFLYNLGVIQLGKRQGEKALTYFKHCLQAKENTSQVYRSLAQALVQLKKPKLGIEALQKSLYLNPRDLDSLFQLAELQHQVKNLEEAVQALQKIVDIGPANANTQHALHKLANIYIDMERYGVATRVLEQAIQLQAQNPRAYFLLGKVYEKSGKLELAAFTWKRALHLQSVSKNTFTVPQKDPLQKIRQQQEPTITYSQQHRIGLALASLYQKQGAHNLAIEQYQQLQKSATPEEKEGLRLSLGKVHMAIQDFKKAILYFKATSQSPQARLEQRRDASAQLARAYIQIKPLRSENVAQALVHIKDALSIDAEDPQTRLTQAWVLIKTQIPVHREKALDILNLLISSVKTPPLLSQAYNLIGLSYMGSGEYHRAVRAFNYSLQLDPSNQEAQRNRIRARNKKSKKEKTF